MPAPIISNFFGDNAQIISGTATITGSANDPYLVIKYSDFSAQSWDSLAGTDSQKPEKWITAIAKKIRDFSAAQTDDISNISISEPFIGLENRNNSLKRRFTYSLDIYQADSGAASPDPDLV